tara:strand:- start:2436 stop:3389 length:954 start_codon:yes stop_codon:yes gene_type:complete
MATRNSLLDEIEFILLERGATQAQADATVRALRKMSIDSLTGYKDRLVAFQTGPDPVAAAAAAAATSGATSGAGPGVSFGGHTFHTEDALRQFLKGIGLGESAIESHVSNLIAGGAFTDTAPTAPTTPSGAPPTAQTSLAAMFETDEATDIAGGFDLFESSMQLLLDTQRGERELRDLESIIKTREATTTRENAELAVRTGQLLTELERVSPTRAAGLAVQLGMTPRQDFSFANVFNRARQGPLAAASGGSIGGQIAGQNVSFDAALRGTDIDFLEKNPNVAKTLTDLSSFFGAPDLISRSRAGRVSASRALAGIAT